MSFVIEITQAAREDLEKLADARVQREIVNGLLRLEVEPMKRGKALKGVLEGYYSIRLARQRYRAVYSVAVTAGIVTVVVIGIRRDGDKRDVYRTATRRLG